jgi:hypothetical protein
MNQRKGAKGAKAHERFIQHLSGVLKNPGLAHWRELACGSSDLAQRPRERRGRATEAGRQMTIYQHLYTIKTHDDALKKCQVSAGRPFIQHLPLVKNAECRMGQQGVEEERWEQRLWNRESGAIGQKKKGDLFNKTPVHSPIPVE